MDLDRLVVREMADKISRTILQYKDMKSLQEFCEAQNTTILQLSKKIQALEEKLKHSEEILKNSNQVPIINSGVEYSQGHSEYICQIEIAKLKVITQERELTYEECKKFDTYYKILNNINSKPNREKDAEQLPTPDLLKLVESKDGNGKQ